MFRLNGGAAARRSCGSSGRIITAIVFLAAALVACAADEAGIQDDQERDTAASDTAEAGHLPQLITRPEESQIGPIRNALTGLCLAASDNGRGLQVIQEKCRLTENQIWRVVRRSGSQVAIFRTHHC